MERDMNYDLELARYIWSILKSDLPVLMSWGVEIETVKVIKCGLQDIKFYNKLIYYILYNI